MLGISSAGGSIRWKCSSTNTMPSVTSANSILATSWLVSSAKKALPAQHHHGVHNNNLCTILEDCFKFTNGNLAQVSDRLERQRGADHSKDVGND
jgi:hypothetical protein